MDFNEANDIATKFAKSRGLKVIESCETENYYVFIPINSSGEAVGMSASITVNKTTRKAELKHYTELIKETIIKEY